MQSTTTSTRTFMPPPPEKEKKPKAPKKRRPFAFKPPTGYLPWLIVLALVIFSLFMFSQYRSAQDKLQSTPQANNKQVVTDVVSRVSKLIILPQDETPTIVAVKDASKLRDELFYKDAKNGDVTLVYPKQKRAILYRPSANVIVNVANVNVTPAN